MHCLSCHLQIGHHWTILVRGRQRAVCDNQHRAISPGAWQVLDSTWSTERCRQGPPVVPAGWYHPPHTSNESLAWLQQRFPDRLISRRCDTQREPHSPNLNPPDFYMWGYIKDSVYGNNSQTIPDLKAVITAAIRAIPREECGGSSRTLPAGSKCVCSTGSSFGAHFVSASETKSFCSTDLKLCRCLLHGLDLMYLKFCVNLSKILEVIRFLVMTIFCVTLYLILCDETTHR